MVAAKKEDKKAESTMLQTGAAISGDTLRPPLDSSKDCILTQRHHHNTDHACHAPEYLQGDQGETNDATQRSLDNSLPISNIEHLKTSEVFKHLSNQILSRILDNSETKTYLPREVIFHQDSPSDSVFYVLRGAVSLTFLSEATGTETTYALRKSGEIFGEMSLLAGSARYATAVSAEKSQVIIIPKDIFVSIFHSSQKMSQVTINKWYRSIVDGRLKIQAYQDHYYEGLMSTRNTLACGQLFGKSTKARKLQRLVQEIIHSGKSALLIGPKGAQKTITALHIHTRSRNHQGQVIVYNPLKIPPLIISQIESSCSVEDQDQLQMAVILGLDQTRDVGTEMPWHGLLKIAQNGTLIIENCGALPAKIQAQLASYLNTGKFLALGATNHSYATTRVIITTPTINDLDQTLLDSLREQSLVLPPLRERKKDLKGLVSHLIEEVSKNNNKTAPSIAPEALNKIMAYDWPGNFRELEDVLLRAVSLKNTDVLRAEDIYIGKVSITGKSAVNLLEIPILHNMFKSSFYPLAPQIFIAVMFAFILTVGIFGAPSPDSNISLLLIWANWEPLLILSCFLFARIWCSFCPIGFLSQHIAGQCDEMGIKGFTLSATTLSKMFYLSAFGLAVVFWSQSTFNMWVNPKETSYLLLTMLGSAIVFSVLFEGRVWCRYICPLGQMVATFARTSILEIRSNYFYCSNECRTYDCSLGNQQEPGCTMAKGPFALDTNKDCTLCGSCIKNCPHQSVRLNLRSPGWELWNSKSIDIAAQIFIPLLWATQIFRGFCDTDAGQAFVGFSYNSKGVSYALILILCIAIACGISYTGVSLMSTLTPKGQPEIGPLHIFAMLPLIYANEIAIRLVPLMHYAADFFVVLGNQIGFEMPQLAFRLDFQSIQILQFALIFVGLLLAILVNKLQLKTLLIKAPKLHISHVPLFIMAAISIVLFY